MSQFTVTVEPVLFLYMFSIFMQYVAFQDFVYEKACSSLFNSTVCANLYASENVASLSLVQRHSSTWILMSTVALVIPSFFLTNLLGSWGDTFGRKLPMLLPPVGGFLSSLVYIWMSYDTVPGRLWPIILASILSGLFGGFVSCIMSVMSYISHVSNEQDRIDRVALVEAMTFLGGTAGPFAGGELQSLFGHGGVFIAISVCYILTFLYVCVFIPNIMISENDLAHRKSYCSCSHFIDSITVCFKNQVNRNSIIAYLICCLIIMMVTAGEMDISYLYVKDGILKWNITLYSYYFGLKYSLGAFVLMVSPHMKKACNIQISDHVVCIIGILSKIAGYLTLSFSYTTELMFIVPIVALLNVFCIPALRSLLSKQVLSDELGKLFACVASVETLCTLLGSVVFNSLYPVMQNIYRGLIFQFAAALHIIPLIIIICIMLRSNRYQPLDNSL